MRKNFEPAEQYHFVKAGDAIRIVKDSCNHGRKINSIAKVDHLGKDGRPHVLIGTGATVYLLCNDYKMLPIVDSYELL